VVPSAFSLLVLACALYVMRFALSPLLVKFVIPKNFFEISLCLFERGDVLVTLYWSTARIISRKRQFHIPVKLVQKKFEVANTRMNILLRIEDVIHPEIFGGDRHQLHKTLRPLNGNRIGIVLRLYHDNCPHEGRIDVVTKGHSLDDREERLFPFN